MSNTSNRYYARWDRTVTLAEKLLDKCDVHRNQLAHIYIWLAVSLATLVLVPLWVLQSHPFPGSTGGILIAGVCVYVFLACLNLYNKYGRVYRSLRRDTRSLNMLVDMMREALPGIQGSGLLSGLDKEQLRIRLARFAIGPGGTRIEGHATQAVPVSPPEQAAKDSLPRIETRSTAP
jgi:hypothetical protein